METDNDIPDAFDPKCAGYLARSRFKPSLRTRLPRFEGSRIPRPVWPRLSSMRRYLPVSVLTAMVYVFWFRIMFLYWVLVFNETMFIRFWSRRVMAGVSMLGWFKLLNVVFIVWIVLDFFVASRDRRKIGRGQKVGYVAALVLLGAMQLMYDRLDYACDYLYRLAVSDDHAHPSLMLRIPPAQVPGEDQPMTFEQCPVGLLLDTDPNCNNMHFCLFFNWEETAPNQFKRRAIQQSYLVDEMSAEMRRRAAQANPRWLMIDLTPRSQFTWSEIVDFCSEAFEAGFERVFLNDRQFRRHACFGTPPPNMKMGRFFSVAEVLPVQPTGWRQGIGPEYAGKGLVRVWACRGIADSPWHLPHEQPGTPVPREIRIWSGPERHLNHYVVDSEGWPSWGRVWFGREEEPKRLEAAISREAKWRSDMGQRDLALWIWANGRVPYKEIAPIVKVVSRTRWDPNAP